MGWIIIVISAVLTVILLSGKGSFLIAGYNTASKKEQMKYDEKKLCRVTGIGLGLITIILLMAKFNAAFSSGIFAVGVITICIVIIILSNTICKVKNPPPVEGTAEENKKLNKGVWTTLIFTVIICIIVAVMLFTGSVTPAFHDKELEITVSYWEDKTIAYKDIKSIKHSDNIPLGTRTNGLGSPKLLAGHFKNKQFGDYLLYAYRNCNQYIVIETKDSVVLLNGETPEATDKIREKLIEKWELSLQ